MPALNKEQILKCNDLKREVVKVPEWGGDVTVRCLTAEERDEFEASMASTGTMDLVNLRARLIALSIIDPEGKRMFSTADAAQLGKKNASVVNRIFRAARKLSGIGLEDVEEMTKN